VNNYFGLLYIAFFKVMQPSMYGVEDRCTGEYNRDNCFDELRTALIGLVFTKVFLGLAMKYIMPYVTLRFNFWMNGITFNSDPEKTDAYDVDDSSSEYLSNSAEKNQGFQHVLCPYQHTIDDFMNVAIMYGYLIMFAAAFPLIPLLVLFFNLGQMKADGDKLLYRVKRPVFMTTRDIGMWFSILQFITLLSVVTNAGIMTVSSDMLSIWSEKYMDDQWSLNKGDSNFDVPTLLVLAGVLEHVVFMVQLAIWGWIADEPDEVARISALDLFEQYQVQTSAARDRLRHRSSHNSEAYDEDSETESDRLIQES